MVMVISAFNGCFILSLSERMKDEKMFDWFGRRMTLEQSEKIILISESVKSGFSLSDAIRMTASSSRRGDAAFLRFADLLDAGTLPEEAALLAGFPKEIRAAFQIACTDPHFADALALQSRLTLRRSRTVFQIVNALTYPAVLLVAALLIFHFILIGPVLNMEQLFVDVDYDLPEAASYGIFLAHAAKQGIFLVLPPFFALFFWGASRTVFPRLGFTVPFLGSVFHRLFQISLLETTAFLVRRGLPFPDILTTCQKLTKNRGLRRDLKRAAADSASGISPTEILLRYPWLFPVWLPSLWSASSESEAASDACGQAADVLESQIQSSLSVLPPLSLVTALIVIIQVLGILVLTLLTPFIYLIEDLSC